MIGSFLTRGLVMIFGYAYPAYECYKTVEMNKPEIEQLRFWCQYWILVAVLTVCERIGDAFISWVPMYSEAKLAFFIYLWYPKTKGTTYVYDSFFRPYVAKHETDIDRNLLELRTRAGDIAVIYWQRAASYGQTRIYEILQYVAAQSTARPRQSQRQQGARVPPDNVAPKRSATTSNQVRIEPPSSPSSSQQQKDVAEEVGAPQVSKLKSTFEVPNTQKVSKPTTVVEVPNTPKGLKPSTSLEAPNTPKGLKPSTSIEVLNAQKAVAAASEPASSSHSSPSEVEPMSIESMPPVVNDNRNPPPKETVMEEPTKVTRARLRKTRSGANH
ncbi:HVA22-like protein i [Benincasa hispida]|uniref:HVA22-like protein i n=1 Tax=Benincasa hispida TaxID=102211 RepID=UPI0018FF5081|nr:HVA22-like protein i [Benincasa hispida]